MLKADDYCVHRFLCSNHLSDPLHARSAAAWQPHVYTDFRAPDPEAERGSNGTRMSDQSLWPVLMTAQWTTSCHILSFDLQPQSMKACKFVANHALGMHYDRS